MSPMRRRSRSTLRAGACADELTAAIAMAILEHRIQARPAGARRPTIPTSSDSTLRASESARRPVLKATELWPATGPRKIVSIVQRWIPIRTDDDAGLKVINDHRLHPRPGRPIVAVAATAPGQVRGVRCRDTGNTEHKCTRKAAAHWICSRTTKQQRNGLQCIRSLRDAVSNRLVTLTQEPATSFRRKMCP